LLDVEVLDLVGGLVGCNYVQKLSETVSLQILFGQVLKVTLGKGDISAKGDFLLVVAYLDGLSEVTGSASDFDALAEVLCEVSSVEDFIFDWFGAIDSETASNFGLNCFLFSGFFLDFSLFGHGCGGGLFCGHWN
jgi:hypothetical protein